MEAKILSGCNVAKSIEEETRMKVDQFYKEYGRVPVLVTIMVGNDESSKTYIRMKSKACERVNIQNEIMMIPEEGMTTEELLSIIQELNGKKYISGILIQHPLPKSIDEKRCFDAIALEKDIDGVNSNSFGKMAMNGTKAAFCSATPQAILDILDYYEIPISGKHAVVVGRSPILGKPVSMMLLNRDATVTICHTKTRHIDELLKSADIVVGACGSPEFIRKEWLKEGVVLLDAGYNPGNVGDISKDAYEIASAYTPVPGGIGPVTIAEVLHNTISAAYLAEKKEKQYQKTLSFRK